MTCVVGIVEKGTVHLGADSLASNWLESTVMQTAKVFRSGEYLFGGCGSLRALQLLHYTLKPPVVPKAVDLERFLSTDLLESIRHCFKEAGFTSVVSGSEEFYGSLLFACRGRLFQIGGQYGLLEARLGYDAIGSGAPFAQGALFATSGRPATQRVLLALQAAEEHGVGVRGPFHIETLAPTDSPAFAPLLPLTTVPIAPNGRRPK